MYAESVLAKTSCDIIIISIIVVVIVVIIITTIWPKEKHIQPSYHGTLDRNTDFRAQIYRMNPTAILQNIGNGYSCALIADSVFGSTVHMCSGEHLLAGMFHKRSQGLQSAKAA